MILIMDTFCLVSLQHQICNFFCRSVIEQPFLRYVDIKPGMPISVSFICRNLNLGIHRCRFILKLMENTMLVGSKWQLKKFVNLLSTF